MATMKFKIHGKTVTVGFHEPTTQEHNEFSNEMDRALAKFTESGEKRDDSALISYQAAVFDKWAETIEGRKKEEITDRQKSVMITRFMSVEAVDEKN